MPIVITKSHQVAVGGDANHNVLTIDGTDLHYNPNTPIGKIYLALAAALAL